MHTRRLASFLLGAWLMASLTIAYMATQNFAEVERVLATPPSAIVKDIDELGHDITRQLLRYQVAEANRFIFETWGIIQVGMGGAFLSSVLITAHRSKFLIISAAVMAVIALIQTFYILPSLASLGRAIDFLPLNANSPERDSHRSFHVMYQVLDILKLMLGIAASGRLLFDRYGWQEKLLPASSSSQRRRRRRKRTSDGSEVQQVDHAHDSHVDG